MEIITILFAFIALIIGYLYVKENKENKRLRIEIEKLKVENASLQEKANFSDELKKLLDGEIVQYLSKTNDHILNLAQKQIQAELKQHTTDMQRVVEPFKIIIDRYDKAVKEYFEKSTGKFGNIDKALEQLQKTNLQLQQETNNLVRIFENSKHRGHWGEIQLRNMLENVGMLKYLDYEEQQHITERLRPDFIIKLPDNRKIIIDVKVPMDDYFKYIKATDENEKKIHAHNHLKTIKNTVKNLAAKKYTQNIENSFNYVILYMPVEPAFTLALHTDYNIYYDALKQNVILTSPTTLFPLLIIIDLMWKQTEATENIGKILEQASKLRDRYATLAGYITDLGKNLDKANQSYNNFIKSWQTRFEPQIRELEKLGVKSSKDTPLTN